MSVRSSPCRWWFAGMRKCRELGEHGAGCGDTPGAGVLSSVNRGAARTSRSNTERRGGVTTGCGSADLVMADYYAARVVAPDELGAPHEDRHVAGPLRCRAGRCRG